MWGETSRLCLLLFGLFIKIIKHVDGKMQIHKGLCFVIQTWIYLNRELRKYVRILKYKRSWNYRGYSFFSNDEKNINTELGNGKQAS